LSSVILSFDSSNDFSSLEIAVSNLDTSAPSDLASSRRLRSMVSWISTFAAIEAVSFSSVRLNSSIASDKSLIRDATEAPRFLGLFFSSLDSLFSNFDTSIPSDLASSRRARAMISWASIFAAVKEDHLSRPSLLLIFRVRLNRYKFSA